MPVKFVTELLKTLFGVSGKDSEGTEAGTNITVERETGEASADESAETDETGETDDLAEESEEVDETEEKKESVDEIRGIGPTYSDRLSEVDIETVGDLAKEDPAAVAAAAEVSESRAADWIERAKNR
jgi:predicted flap endonuclease-1-like 5' DNA nuclease